jgi:site-specific recombinase XerD
MTRPTGRVSRFEVAGPLAPFVDAYEAELSDRGYAPRTIVNQLRQVARLSGWLEASGLTLAALSNERLEQFRLARRAGGRGAVCSLQGLMALLEVLRGLGVLEAESSASVDSAAERLLASFGDYLLGERGLAAGTAVAYVGYARRFLAGLAGGGELSGVTAGEVTGAVLRESVVVSASSAQYFVTALRSFLRFCLIEGLVEADLSAAALAVTGRRRSSLPMGISKSDAAALLGCCDRRRALGRRDYAVMITLLRLGLRAGEAARLTLDDVDWRAGEIVVHGKGRREDRLPLPADVGEAIAGYLRRGRPESSRRELFLRARAPIGALGRGGVSAIVRRACARAGVPGIGAHRLRHTVACEMVSVGVPLPEIGQVLRHRSLQTTANYARVDLDRLRLLAQPWPQGARR